MIWWKIGPKSIFFFGKVKIDARVRRYGRFWTILRLQKYMFLNFLTSPNNRGDFRKKCRKILQNSYFSMIRVSCASPGSNSSKNTRIIKKILILEKVVTIWRQILIRNSSQNDIYFGISYCNILPWWFLLEYLRPPSLTNSTNYWNKSRFFKKVFVKK